MRHRFYTESNWFLRNAFYESPFHSSTSVIGHGIDAILQMGVFVFIMGSPDLKKIESDRDYQKNKERVHELKVLWKKERLHLTINKYIETLTFT